MGRVQSAPQADDTEVFVREFFRVLNQIADDYPNGFRNIKGQLISDDDDISNQWATSAALPEAIESYISKKLNQDMVYVALFYHEPDESMANTIYENLVWLVNNCSFSCCSFVYDSVENDGSKTTFWIPFDTGGNAKYDNMLVEVRLYQSIDITDDFDIIDTWGVVVNFSTLRQ